MIVSSNHDDDNAVIDNKQVPILLYKIVSALT
jgi:hypothetical protein